jgi:hypothetical protein
VKKICKAFSIPLLALFGVLALSPAVAKASVGFGITVGPTYAYPSYVYPYASPYYNPYYEPYVYPYAYGYEYPGFGLYFGGGHHEHFEHHERGHERGFHGGHGERGEHHK